MNGVYDLKLVALSVIIAMFASYTALDLAARVNAGTTRQTSLWTIGGALAMGTGIWAMHFVGMLAFQLPIPVAFDPLLNGLSWLMAFGASGVALVVVGRSTMTGASLSTGAAIMGVGIATMHYTGMAAMRMSPPISYDPPLFVASVLVAIGASLAALWLAFHLRSRHSTLAVFLKLGSAVVMGIAISGMHYIGMAAAQFSPDSVCLSAQSANALDRDTLAAMIAISAFAILSTTLAVSAWDAHRAARALRYAETLKSTNDQLRKIALHDPLTGLPNRILLEDRAQQTIARARRHGEICAMMFIDLDRFKAINDTYGHDAGDALLKAVAHRLTDCLRREDTVSRTGGDEFAVIAGDMKSPSDAARTAEKIVRAMSAPFDVAGHRFQVSCSVGISLYPGDGQTMHELMANADAAMYRVKREGRNGYRLFALDLPQPGSATEPADS